MMPRWEDDPVAKVNGWNTPDRCGNCGESNPQVAALTAERDGAMRGAREGTAALTAERDALLVRVERLEGALSDLLGWECGGIDYIRRLHYERDDGECDYCTGAWPCSAIEALDVLDAPMTPTQPTGEKE